MNQQDYRSINIGGATIASGYPKGQGSAMLDAAASVQDRLVPLVEQADAIVGRLMAILDEPVLPQQNPVVTGTTMAGPPPLPGCHAQINHLEDALSRIGTKVGMVQSRVGRL